jgi:hypothetical protein
MVEEDGLMTLAFELAHFVGHDGHEEPLLAERLAMVRALKRASKAAPSSRASGSC